MHASMSKGQKETERRLLRSQVTAREEDSEEKDIKSLFQLAARAAEKFQEKVKKKNNKPLPGTWMAVTEYKKSKLQDLDAVYPMKTEIRNFPIILKFEIPPSECVKFTDRLENHHNATLYGPLDLPAKCKTLHREGVPISKNPTFDQIRPQMLETYQNIKIFKLESVKKPNRGLIDRCHKLREEWDLDVLGDDILAIILEEQPRKTVAQKKSLERYCKNLNNYCRKVLWALVPGFWPNSEDQRSAEGPIQEIMEDILQEVEKKTTDKEEEGFSDTSEEGTLTEGTQQAEIPESEDEEMEISPEKEKEKNTQEEDETKDQELEELEENTSRQEEELEKERRTPETEEESRDEVFNTLHRRKRRRK